MDSKRSPLRSVIFICPSLISAEFEYDLCLDCLVKIKCYTKISFNNNSYSEKHFLFKNPCFRLPHLIKKMRKEWVLTEAFGNISHVYYGYKPHSRIFKILLKDFKFKK